MTRGLQVLGRDASVHESTVKRVNQMDPFGGKSRVVRRGRKVSDTYSLKVDPRVMRAAKKRLASLRDRGYSRIEIVDAGTVVIR